MFKITSLGREGAWGNGTNWRNLAKYSLQAVRWMKETLQYSYEPLRFSRLKSLHILSFLKNLPPLPVLRSWIQTFSQNIPLEMGPKLKRPLRKNSSSFRRRSPNPAGSPVSAGFGSPHLFSPCPNPPRRSGGLRRGAELPLSIWPGKWANGRSAVSEESVGLIID